MTTQEVKDKIYTIVADVIGCDYTDVDDNARFDVLGADSLDTVEVLMDIEKEFHISVPDDSVVGIITVGQLADVILSKVNTEE